MRWFVDYDYKGAAKKIKQVKKYILLVATLLPIVSLAAQALQTNLDDSIYVKGYKCNNEGNKCKLVIMGVQGISYVLSPAQDNKSFVSFEDKGALKLVKGDVGRENLFSFKLATEESTSRYNLLNANSEKITNSGKDVCFIGVAFDSCKFNLLCREHNDDERLAILQYNLEKKETWIEPSKGNDHFSTIKPAYEFSSLEQVDVDKKTWLFKFPKRENVSGKILSVDQIKALYTLKYDGDRSKQLTVVGENDDFIYAYTNSLSYCTKGLSIKSVDLPLRIEHIKQFSKIVKGSGSIEKINKNHDPDVVELAKGKTLILIPEYGGQSIPLFGDITITPIGGRFSKYDKVECKMGELRKLRNTGRLRIFPDYVVEFAEDSIWLSDASNSILTSVGRTFYVLNGVSKEVVYDAATKTYIIVENLFTATEELGKEIKEASKTASETLLKVSKDFSGDVRDNIINLSNTIVSVSKDVTNTFQNVTNTFQTTSFKLSDDMKNNVKRISDSLNLLGDNIKASSNILGKGAIKTAECFKEASKVLSKGLNDSSVNVKDGLQIAAGLIREGLQNIKVDADVSFFGL